MSSQRGNVKKCGPPKHQNRSVFKNTLHDTSKKTKQIVELDVSGLCARCTEIIEWKIKYKKYKPLTQPRKCVLCSQKTVKRAYYILCESCSTSKCVCAKCGESKDLVSTYSLSASEQARQNSELSLELQGLSERKRRAFIRMQEKAPTSDDPSKIDPASSDQAHLSDLECVEDSGSDQEHDDLHREHGSEMNTDMSGASESAEDKCCESE